MLPVADNRHGVRKNLSNWTLDASPFHRVIITRYDAVRHLKIQETHFES